MNTISRTLLLAAGCVAAPLALAHTGEAAHAHATLADGLLHPFTGIDHLLAMLAVGAWSALALRRLWVAPAAFVALLAIGALAGASGVQVPAIEPMIAASLLVVGLLVATVRRLPVVLAAGIAGAFAFFHGAAHGSELGAGASVLAGMLVATAVLHAAGIALGQWVLARVRWLPQLSGGLVAALGAVLLVRLA
jgi:urease accessory protein